MGRTQQVDQQTPAPHGEEPRQGRLRPSSTGYGGVSNHPAPSPPPPFETAAKSGLLWVRTEIVAFNRSAFDGLCPAMTPSKRNRAIARRLPVGASMR